MVAPVGEHHLGAVLAQSVGNAAAHQPVCPKDGDNVAAEGGAAATAPLHRRQVDLPIPGLQLGNNTLKIPLLSGMVKKITEIFTEVPYL